MKSQEELLKILKKAKANGHITGCRKIMRKKKIRTPEVKPVVKSNIRGLEKDLNSTLPVGQVTLIFCLPSALPRLPKFSNSLLIHETKNGSQTTGMF